jgi:hypothetical protein
MPYVIQAEEREIDVDLLQRLADVLLDEVSDLTRADATYRVRRAGGILQVKERAAAGRISARFTELGLHSFVVEELLEPPRPQHLNLEKPEIEGEVELAVAGRLHQVDRKVIKTTRVGLSLPWAMAGIPVPKARTEERRVEESDTRYALDLFASGTHWRARPGYPQAVEDMLVKVVTPATSLSAGAASLLQGGRDIPEFGQEADYERYVTWLYQQRYAGRG